MKEDPTTAKREHTFRQRTTEAAKNPRWGITNAGNIGPANKGAGVPEAAVADPAVPAIPQVAAMVP